jgi:Na+/melibiose symporter-like transporter
LVVSVALQTMVALIGALSRSRRLDIAYVFAVLARGLSWCFTEMFLAYHLHAHAGLTAAQTGATLLVLLSIGAGADLGAGWLLRGRLGHCAAILRVQRAGAIVVAFAIIPLFQSGVTVAGALMWGATYRMAFSFYAIPQMALLGALSTSRAAQRRLVRLHAFAIAGARLLTAGMALAIVGQSGVGAWRGQTLLPVIIGACVLATVYVLERAIRVRAPTIATQASAIRDRGGWPAGLASVLIATACHAGALFMISRLFLFTPRHGGEDSSGPWLLFAWTIGMTVGPCVVAKGHRHLFPAALVVATAASILILVPDLSPVVRLAAAFVYGLGLSVAGVELLARVTRLSTEGNGVADGRIFALFGCTAKLAMAAGNGSLAFLIGDYASGSRWAGTIPALIGTIGAIIGIAAWCRSPRPRCDRSRP